MKKLILIILMIFLIGLFSCEYEETPMSGSIIYTPNTGADWPDAWQQLEYTRKGKLGLSLTEWESTTVPQIGSGSWAEVAGSIYKWVSNDSITGTPSSGEINFIKLVPGGSGDTAYVTPTWTTDAPSWSDSYQGWYIGTSRYVAGCVYDGTYYTYKFILDKGKDVLKDFVIEIGDWNMDADGQKDIDVGYAAGYIRKWHVIIRQDADGQRNPFEDWSNQGRSVINMTSRYLSLFRTASGGYDNSTFDSTSYNRGWVVITLKVI